MREEGADATERTETRRNDFCRVLPSSDDCFGISAALRSRVEGAAAPSPSPPHRREDLGPAPGAMGGRRVPHCCNVVVPRQRCSPGCSGRCLGAAACPSLGDGTEVSPGDVLQQWGGLQGRGASPDTLKMLLCLPRRRRGAGCQLHQQLPQSRLLGVHQGHWGSVARGRGRLQSGWKAQKSDRNQGWGLGGTGLGTSLLWVALAAASSELIHVLCKLRFLLISRAVPGGVWPRGGAGGVSSAASQTGGIREGAGARPWLGLGGVKAVLERTAALARVRKREGALGVQERWLGGSQAPIAPGSAFLVSTSRTGFGWDSVAFRLFESLPRFKSIPG